MLLALFLIELAAGLYVFLPLVGRRNAGVKFYRLILIIGAGLSAGAGVSHMMAGRKDLAAADAATIVTSALLWVVLRYPKRLIYLGASILLGLVYLGAAILAYDAAIAPRHPAWSVIGALSTIALLGSVNMAMTLGHWYLVVRGMPIDPLKRLAMATLAATVVRVLVVVIAIAIGGVFHEVAVRNGIFFLMRAGWGLLGPLVLFPMVWGTVRIRSTMAATGILYVEVVAVVIGEVLGGWLSALVHLPV
jgi:hypothetical protein